MTDKLRDGEHGHADVSGHALAWSSGEVLERETGLEPATSSLEEMVSQKMMPHKGFPAKSAQKTPKCRGRV
ncbi:MAG: hypothetical protein M3R48_04075, partial [Candidatus Dormibacteraeota bacterium]|nr:hypothetical protein [Candidatus Dormibacteraeota bacterium]